MDSLFPISPEEYETHFHGMQATREVEHLGDDSEFCFVHRLTVKNKKGVIVYQEKYVTE